MTQNEIRDLCRQKLNLRLEPEMAAYVLRRLSPQRAVEGRAAIAVIGGDARTGRPLRAEIQAEQLIGGLGT